MGSKNSQTTPATTTTTAVRQFLGTANAQTAPAATNTAPAHQPLGTANAQTTPAGAQPAATDKTATTRRNMRREEWVTVQGPVKKQQPDGMSHRGVKPSPFFWPHLTTAVEWYFGHFLPNTRLRLGLREQFFLATVLRTAEGKSFFCARGASNHSGTHAGACMTAVQARTKTHTVTRTHAQCCAVTMFTDYSEAALRPRVLDDQCAQCGDVDGCCRRFVSLSLFRLLPPALPPLNLLMLTTEMLACRGISNGKSFPAQRVIFARWVPLM